MQIYIHRDGQQFGPYSVEQVRDYMASGNLLAGDLAWHEGAADWVPLAQIEGVVPEVSAPKPERAWIPPRRGDEPTPVAAVISRPSTAAPISSSVPVSKVATGSGQPAPIVASGNSQRTSRKASPDSNWITQRQRSIGLRNMGIGGVVCVVGTVITLVTYENAVSGPGGGHYFVAWGAIVFGGIQFVKGVIQFCQA